MTLGLGLGLGEARPSPNDIIRALFAGTTQGIWLDPSDRSTLFQDSAGTTPVTAAGQPVGLILDKSGRGNNAVQTTAGKRPTYQIDSTGRPFLLFDGVDDCLETGNINLSASDKLTALVGIRKLTNAASFPIVMEFGFNWTAVDGSFVLCAMDDTPGTYYFGSRGTISATASPGGFSAPVTNVVTLRGDIGGDIARLRVNGTQVANVTTDQGTGNFGTAPLFIGQRGGSSLPLEARIYSLIVRSGAVSDIAAVERWVNGKTGAF